MLLCVEGRAEARLASRVLCGALCTLQLLLVHLALQAEDLVAERGDSLLCLNLCLLRLLRLELLDVLDGLFPGLLLRAQLVLQLCVLICLFFEFLVCLL